MSADPLVRVPPHSLEAEQSLLGGLLLDNRVHDRVADVVHADDFYREDHRRIFRHVTKLIEAGKPADVVTVSESIEASEDKDRTGGPAYLGALVQNSPGALNVRRYAELVRDKSRLRAVAAAGQELTERALAGTGDAAEILSSAEERLLGLLDHGTRDYAELRDVLAGVVERVDEAYHLGSDLCGLPSGLVDLDAMTGGFEPGELVIVAGRPGMGKTAFAMNVAEHVTREVGPVAVFSLEMSQAQVGMRVLAGRARIPMTDLRRGRLTDAMWPELTQAVAELADLPLVIDDSAGVTCAHVRARARRIQRRYGRLALVVVDYLQLMRGKGDTREQEVAGLSRGLKAVAKDLGVPVLCLAQLNRALTQRQDKRPQLADLRESGAIEQDADVILFLHREELYDPETWQRGCAQLLVRKQRNGPTGDVWLTYREALMRFENCAQYPVPTASSAQPHRVGAFRVTRPVDDVKSHAAGDDSER